MKHFQQLLILFGFGLAACQTPDTNDMNSHSILPMQYPVSRVETVKDTLWGVEVSDPYRWLEDDRSSETEAWVAAQNQVTQAYLSSLPLRDEMAQEFRALYDYEKMGMPRRIGHHYYIAKNSGLQNQPVYYRRTTLDGPESVYLDPNTWSDDGTITGSLSAASKDDRYIALIRNEAGSDWQEIRVLVAETGEELPDRLTRVKFSGASWWRDGFFYSRYPEPKGSDLSAENTYHSVYYHRLGTQQSEDILIYMNPDEPNRYHFGGTTEDESMLILNTSTGTDGNSIHVLDLNGWDGQAAPEIGDFQPVVEGFDSRNSVADIIDKTLYLLTDINAPKYRLVAVPLNAPADRSQWRDFIPESDDLLEAATFSGGHWFVRHLHNACSRVTRWDLSGTESNVVTLPQETGTVGGFGGKHDANELFYAFTSFNYPTTIFRYDITTGESSVFAAPKVAFEPENYVAEQIWYDSKDGTSIPMFVVRKKDTPLDGKRPTYLYAYGGFNISLTPSFSPSLLLLLNRGGVYAMPNLRGGGEFGEAWHEAGMLLRKQNVFDDFIAAGEHLIASNYTRHDRLAIAGGSNGGLLVGATMTQRPDLAAVAFPAVGVMDMLRYHKFTIGWGWIPEYGCADSSLADFNNLAGYSPYHNLAPGVNYPATMVTTADHDDRVVPAHSFKFAARLQACQAGNRPALIRVETDAGHGAGKPTSKIIEEQADKWAFMLHNMGITE
ncbi:MAG: prolyl oligopeptidase family serine peptidase [Flavobacteriales bacterium]